MTMLYLTQASEKEEFKIQALLKNKGREGADKSSKINLVLPLFCSMLLNDSSHAAFTAIPVKYYVIPTSSYLGTFFGKNNCFGFFSNESNIQHPTGMWIAKLT